MKKIFFLLLLTGTLTANAQSVVGYWYGTANVASGNASNNYMIELIVKQNQSAVQAILNYYFRNTFRSIQIKGNYNSITRELSLYNIPVPYFGLNNTME